MKLVKCALGKAVHPFHHLHDALLALALLLAGRGNMYAYLLGVFEKRHAGRRWSSEPVNDERYGH